MGKQQTLITDFIYENQAALYRLAFSYTHNRDAALDIVQDTVVQAISHADALRDRQAVKPGFIGFWSMKASLICGRIKSWFFSMSFQTAQANRRISAKRWMSIVLWIIWS